MREQRHNVRERVECGLEIALLWTPSSPHNRATVLKARAVFTWDVIDLHYGKSSENADTKESALEKNSCSYGRRTLPKR